MKRLSLLLLAVAFAGCASAPAERASEAPAGRVERDPGLVSRAPEPVDVFVDVGDRELAAYDITIVYDRSLVRVTAVEPSGEFAPPQYLRNGLTSGELKLAAYQLERHPRGRIVVARLHFESFGGPSSPLTIRVRTLADSMALPLKGRVEASRDRVP